MTPNEYLQLKTRLLLAAEACGVIARATDTVRFDEEMHRLVMEAFAHCKTDVLRVFTELDILRDQCGLSLFPRLLGESDANDPAPNDSGTMDVVPPPANEASGAEIPNHNTADGGAVPTGGADGVEPKVSKPRRNRGRKSKASGELGRADADGQMDR